jgi:cellulose synthase/poly-beta-1,6-N-acetylglucosamine synthase-like glycosyltransferase
MTLLDVGFWIALGLIAYIYVGYPAIAFLLARIRRRAVRKADVTPRVTVVISAFNEEQDIEGTVDNKLAQDYPAERLDVLVVSDGSSDRTDDIVRGLAQRSGGRVRLLRQEPRQGKTQALNLALRQVTAEIVVFADANSLYAPDAVRKLARNFADPEVGYVTGRMVYANPSGSGIGEGSGSYMSYENALRTWETGIGSIVGVDGGIDAARRELYVPMRADQLPDFVLPLTVVERGKRVVYEPGAVLREPALADAASEFQMRVRVALRALWALWDKRALLNPARRPLFAWQLASHKVLRYGAFLPLATLLACNVALAGRSAFYAAFMGLQLVLYAAAAAGHLLRRSPARAARLLAPYYFVILNAACALAFWKLLNGQRMALWKPRQGAQ